MISRRVLRLASFDRAALLRVLQDLYANYYFSRADRWDLKQMVMKEESGFITGDLDHCKTAVQVPEADAL